MVILQKGGGEVERGVRGRVVAAEGKEQTWRETGLHGYSEMGRYETQHRLHIWVGHGHPNSIPYSPLPQPGLESDPYLGTDTGDRRRHAIWLHAWDLEPHNCLVLRAQRLQAAVLEAGPEGAAGATEPGLVQV